MTASYYMLMGGTNGYMTGSIPFERTQIARFTPRYWRIDGPRSMSFCLTSESNGFDALFIARYADDLCGILWDTRDSKDHVYLAYAENPDYRDCVWDFDIQVSDTMPLLNDAQRGLTMTVYGLDEDGYEAEWYVALARYADTPGARSAHITIDWNTVKAGFAADEPINTASISRVMISGATSQYDAEAGQTPLPQAVEAWIKVRNSRTRGSAGSLALRAPTIPAHALGICTSYDDHYDLTPERIIENCYALGYRDWVNHYVGMSTYPERRWSDEVNRFVVVDAPGVDPVNPACRRWHSDFALQCARRGFKLIQSVSYELFSEISRLDWTQRDWQDNYGATGWTPPSYLLSHCNIQAQAWLHRVFLSFTALADAAGLDLYVQVGEPWWWWNGDSRRPCVYDYPTRLAFNAATGLYAPEFPTIDADLTGTPYDEFKAFLRDALGNSVLAIRDAVKAVHPHAQVTTLFFLPSILTPKVGIMQTINYPATHYAWPNLDFFMTEAYDWLITAQVYLAETAITRPMAELGYPADKIHYLGGFVPDANMAALLGFNPTLTYRQEIWQRIFGNLWNNAEFTGLTQHIWSYPQLMADSITYLPEDHFTRFYARDELWPAVRDDTPYLIGGDGSVPPGIPSGPGQPETTVPKRPVNLRAIRSSWGDVRISWSSSVDDPGAIYVVEVLSFSNLEVLWSVTVSDMFALFPATQSTPIFGFPPTYLRYRIRRVAGARSQIVAQDIPLDDSVFVDPRPRALQVVRNSWGDLYMSWQDGDLAEGSGTRRYRVDLFNGPATAIIDTVLATDRNHAGYTVETQLSLINAEATYLTFTVTLVGADGNALSAPSRFSGEITLDNTFVKKVAVLGINSLIGGYFNDLSDSQHPGNTGAPGDKRYIAARTFRTTLATRLGLETWEVIPVMAVIGSSPINPMPYQPGFPQDNYWWDATTQSPGPNLRIADGIVRALGRAPDYFVQSGPGETTGIAFASASQRPAILDAWRSSNVAMLAWMRANWGNAALEIWFQGATTSWWGPTAPPDEVNYEGAKLLRDVQTEMALNVTGFKMASYVPDAHRYSTYLNEAADGLGWVHYTPAGYHAAAADVAEALALGLNRATQPPAWALVQRPINPVASKRLNNDIVLSWGSAAHSFVLRILSPVTSEVVREKRISGGPSYVLSVAEQVALFGFEASYIDYRVAEYSDALGEGPFNGYTGSVYRGNLATPQNLTAVKRANGDIRFTWTAIPGATYWFRNFDVGNLSLIAEGPLTTNEYVFSIAEQHAHYNFWVSLVRLDVYQYDPATDTVGQPAYWNDNAQPE
ncbi:hypothetical protein [Stenotrophomonas sp. 364]|uniref:non-contractile tail sheath protein n=1 Tax=Stenotrophomonas sp. 364 TaxID=2691571 RepID=UPI0013163465|nr:hypothetical protein [Stenotrophomonas sp. 364]QHB72931.1 hypothetical protein GQ674_17260 [Stenotrophomonas sp. 364]